MEKFFNVKLGKIKMWRLQQKSLLVNIFEKIRELCTMESIIYQIIFLNRLLQKNMKIYNISMLAQGHGDDGSKLLDLDQNHCERRQSDKEWFYYCAWLFFVCNILICWNLKYSWLALLIVLFLVVWVLLIENVTSLLPHMSVYSVGLS